MYIGKTEVWTYLKKKYSYQSSMKRLYIFILASALLVTGCNKYKSEEVLLPRTDISLTIKGEEIMTFNAQKCQLGYNDQRYEFRVLNDKLTDWFILRCSENPKSVGQVIKASLEYTTSDDIKTEKGLTFTVEKISKDGFIWMWEEEEKIGAVIKIL